MERPVADLPDWLSAPSRRLVREEMEAERSPDVEDEPNEVGAEQPDDELRSLGDHGANNPR
jgi:hypothetical protein